MTAVRRGLFTVLGAATAATTLGVWTPIASAQSWHSAKNVGQNATQTTTAPTTRTNPWVPTGTTPTTTTNQTGTQTTTTSTTPTDQTGTQTSTTPTTTTTQTSTQTTTTNPWTPTGTAPTTTTGQSGTQTSTTTTTDQSGTQTSTAPTTTTDQTGTQTATAPTTTTDQSGTQTSTAPTTTTDQTGTQTASSPSLVQYFPAAAIWTQDVSNAPVDPQSATMINALAQAGGWGTGSMRVDFSLRVLQANASTPTVPFRPSQGFLSVDSDLVPSVPLPPGGGMEAQSGYQCDPSQQDCHFIVVDNDQGKLYEAYGANYDGTALSANVLAVWNLNLVYPASGRGDQCTSADAAGYPIAPLLFNANELAQGHIDHAIRFILPNDRIRAGVFVHPATHAGNPQGSASTPPYGAHLRLKASYDLSQLKPAARVVAQAMQKYGMFLADGGNIALTAQSDQDTQTKYSDVDFSPTDLSSLKVTDFEVVQMGPTIPLTYDCVRNP